MRACDMKCVGVWEPQCPYGNQGTYLWNSFPVSGCSVASLVRQEPLLTKPTCWSSFLFFWRKALGPGWAGTDYKTPGGPPAHSFPDARITGLNYHD